MSEFWYQDRTRRTKASAECILRLVFDTIPVNSVIDVGCGTGTWLAVAQSFGAQKVLGLDGSHVPQEMLELEADQFSATDLGTFNGNLGQFDLALSLEVAEHLPAERGEAFVSLLCSASECVLFSAAIPGQGGSGHINERPQSYWSDLFESHGYMAFDFIRPQIWNDANVMRWYRQNTVLYSKRDLSQRLMEKNYTTNSPGMIDVVHPDVFNKYRMQKETIGIRMAARHVVVGLKQKLIGRWPSG